jgi:metal transporter CNNM
VIRLHSLTKPREIIDESDVYIDVHKAIRRMTPAPKSLRFKQGSVTEHNGSVHVPETLIDVSDERPAVSAVNGKHLRAETRSSSPAAQLGTSPNASYMRRVSTGASDTNAAPLKGNMNDLREHLKHLGPSNLASRPKMTKYQSVKIKPGSIANRSESRTDSTVHRESIAEVPYTDHPAPHGGEGEGLLRSAGMDAKDGVQALQQGYGSIQQSAQSAKPENRPESTRKLSSEPQSPGAGQQLSISNFFNKSNKSSDTIGSLRSHTSGSPSTRRKGTARSGSITENLVEAGGIRKMVLETNVNVSSGEEEGRETHSSSSGKSAAATRWSGFLSGERESEQTETDDAGTGMENGGEGKKKKGSANGGGSASSSAHGHGKKKNKKKKKKPGK